MRDTGSDAQRKDVRLMQEQQLQRHLRLCL